MDDKSYNPGPLRAVGSDDARFVQADPVRTAQVIRLGCTTRLDSEPHVILEGAKGLRCIVVIGYDADGSEHFASSMADGADALWLIERCKARLLKGE